MPSSAIPRTQTSPPVKMLRIFPSRISIQFGNLSLFDCRAPKTETGTMNGIQKITPNTAWIAIRRALDTINVLPNIEQIDRVTGINIKHNPRTQRSWRILLVMVDMALSNSWISVKPSRLVRISDGIILENSGGNLWHVTLCASPMQNRRVPIEKFFGRLFSIASGIAVANPLTALRASGIADSKPETAVLTAPWIHVSSSGSFAFMPLVTSVALRARRKSTISNPSPSRWVQLNYALN